MHTELIYLLSNKKEDESPLFKKYIAWAPMYIYQGSYLYFNEETFDFEWPENDFIPKFYLDRSEAESIIIALTIADKDCQHADVVKILVTEQNGKVVNWIWEDYTKEEILQYYGPDFL